jgi:transposase
VARTRLPELLPAEAVACPLAEHDTRLRCVIRHYVERAPAHTELSAVTRAAIDETAARRGHHYTTLLVDID